MCVCVYVDVSVCMLMCVCLYSDMRVCVYADMSLRGCILIFVFVCMLICVHFGMRMFVRACVCGGVSRLAVTLYNKYRNTVSCGRSY